MHVRSYSSSQLHFPLAIVCYTKLVPVPCFLLLACCAGWYVASTCNGLVSGARLGTSAKFAIGSSRRYRCIVKRSVGAQQAKLMKPPLTTDLVCHLKVCCAKGYKEDVCDVSSTRTTPLL